MSNSSTHQKPTSLSLFWFQIVGKNPETPFLLVTPKYNCNILNSCLFSLYQSSTNLLRLLHWITYHLGPQLRIPHCPGLWILWSSTTPETNTWWAVQLALVGYWEILLVLCFLHVEIHTCMNLICAFYGLLL